MGGGGRGVRLLWLATKPNFLNSITSSVLLHYTIIPFKLSFKGNHLQLNWPNEYEDTSGVAEVEQKGWFGWKRMTVFLARQRIGWKRSVDILNFQIKNKFINLSEKLLLKKDDRSFLAKIISIFYIYLFSNGSHSLSRFIWFNCWPNL